MTPNQSTLIRLHQERAAALAASMLMLRVNTLPQKQEYFKSTNHETTK
jgi:hypothetical protein